MNKLILILSLLNFQIGFSQSNFKIGSYYNFGASSYYGNKMTSMSANIMDMPVYSAKLSTGMGVKFQYALKEKWGVTLSSGYQQRGAMFDKGLYSYNPRYKFNYLDVALGMSYQTKELFKKVRLYFNVAATYHKLLNSLRVNNYESYNLKNDSKMNDFGALATVGFNIPRVEKDVIQVSLFTNAGFQNVFSGVLLENGQIGKNILFGIQVGYLFGCERKIKKE